MKVGDLMTREVELLPGDVTVQEAATRMAEYDVGAMMIGHGDRLDGILTERDILLRVVIEGRNPTEVRAEEVMSTTLFTCREDDAAENALAAMTERQVRRLPVVKEDGGVIGIVTLSDLAKSAGNWQEAAVEKLREVAEPHRRVASGGQK